MNPAVNHTETHENGTRDNTRLGWVLIRRGLPNRFVQLKELLSGTKNELLAFMAFIGTFLDFQERKGERIAEQKFSGDTAVSRFAQTATIITVVAIGIVSAIGILIYSQVSQSLQRPQNEQLNGSLTNVTEGFGSAMDLVPTVLIVLVAALVIGVVQRLR